VTDYTLLLNALSLGTSNARLAGAPFGAQDPYGVGLPKGSDGVAFINAFLKKLEADGTWAKLWTISIGQRTGSTTFRRRPLCLERWVRFPGFGRLWACLLAGPLADMEAHAGVLRARGPAGHGRRGA
jgi:hypothetical protein